nr:SGNH/GDSL hydrolase family protein [Lachnospiraceae bacterium]
LGGMRTNELVAYAKNGFIDTDEKPDFITVLMGTNDWGNNRTLAEFEADVSELMDILQSKYPESKIVFLTPLYRDHFGERTFIPSGMVNKNGNHLYEYSDIIKKQAAAHNVAVIELDENTYINADNIREYTADGLHPNTAGNKLIADRLYQPLMEVIQK